MIRYALVCDRDHGFEGWFAASDDYDDQAARGLVECPVCLSRAVRKQIMAPALCGVRKTVADEEPSKAPATSPGPPQAMMMEALGRIRRHVLDRFENVGDAFAAEARRIHAGESEDRGIYGQARPEEVRALHADGIAVAPLPPDPKDLN